MFVLISSTIDKSVCRRDCNNSKTIEIIKCKWIVGTEKIRYKLIGLKNSNSTYYKLIVLVKGSIHKQMVCTVRMLLSEEPDILLWCLIIHPSTLTAYMITNVHRKRIPLHRI